MNDGLEKFLTQFFNEAVQLAPKLLAGALIFLAFWVGARIVMALIIHACKRTRRIDQSLASLLAGTAYIAVLIFGIVTALGTIGVNVGALIAGLGLSGFAVSFALKDGLSNILAGISILLYHPFRVGDHISVTGLEGRVVSIDLRYTILRTQDKRILIPNSTLFTNSIVVSESPQVEQSIENVLQG